METLPQIHKFHRFYYLLNYVIYCIFIFSFLFFFWWVDIKFSLPFLFWDTWLSRIWLWGKSLCRLIGNKNVELLTLTLGQSLIFLEQLCREHPILDRWCERIHLLLQYQIVRCLHWRRHLQLWWFYWLHFRHSTHWNTKISYRHRWESV